MHVRQLAWLSSCPTDTSKKENKDKRSRFVRFNESDPDCLELKLPDVNGADYLVNLLHEAGPVGSNGYGIEGLRWSEIYSWLATTGLFLEPWESILIKKMSDAYAAEFNRSNGKECAPPYRDKKLVSQDKLNTAFEMVFRTRYEEQEKSKGKLKGK